MRKKRDLLEMKSIKGGVIKDAFQVPILPPLQDRTDSEDDSDLDEQTRQMFEMENNKMIQELEGTMDLVR